MANPQHLRNISVYLTSTENEVNDVLLTFFETNLDTFNRQRMAFEWVVVYDDEKPNYAREGLTTFPVMMVGNQQIVGFNQIEKYLLQGPSAVNGSKPSHDVTNVAGLENYMYKELQNGYNPNGGGEEAEKEFGDMEPLQTSDVVKRMTAMNTHRESFGLQTIQADTNAPTNNSDSYGSNASLGNRGSVAPQRAQRYSSFKGDDVDIRRAEGVTSSGGASPLDIIQQKVANKSEMSTDDAMEMAYWANMETM